ncbi:MAG: Ig-like domain-containing protein [Bacteroidales bacterium]
MKRKSVFLSVILVTAMFAVILSSCKKEPTDFTLAAMVTGTIDLNGATSPNTVPVKPAIVATFNTDVDVATAVPANVALVQDYDKAVMAVTVTASGKTITVTPTEDLGNGALYKLTLSAGLKSTGGLALTSVARTFTTLGTFVPKGAIAYWNFEDNANDQIGAYDPASGGVVAITYAASRNTAAGKAATFDGATSIIEVPNGDVLMNSPDFTLSFWVKTNSTGHLDAGGNPAGYFVIGLAAFYGFQFEITSDFSWCKLAARYDIGGGESSSEDLWFPGDGKTKDNGGWQGWEFCKDLTGSGGVAGLLKDKWAQVVCMFEASTKRGTMFINGEKMKVFNFNLWPDGDAKRNVTGMKYGGTAPETVNELAFGFIQSRAGTLWDTEPWGGYDFPTSNHFKGQLDDIRIFHKALTETEIQLMYNSEK